ncbi:MAG: hypothetical protein AAGG75_26060 [Bacteroidota bacterium]
MPLKDFTLLLIRLFLGYVFFFSGLCKLSGGNFGQLIGNQPNSNSIPRSIALFPKLALPINAVGFTLLAIVLAINGSPIFNFQATAAVAAILLNLRQYPHYSRIDTIISSLFGLYVLFMIFHETMYAVWPKAAFLLIAMVLIAIGLYLIKLIGLSTTHYRVDKNHIAE